MDEEHTGKQGKGQPKSCKLCGKEISPYSPFCRNCGHPQGRPLIIALLILFLLVLLALYVGFALFCACNPERFEPHPGGSGSADKLEDDGKTAQAGFDLSKGNTAEFIPMSGVG